MVLVLQSIIKRDSHFSFFLIPIMISILIAGISPISPTLSVWTSYEDNKISTVELETDQEFANFVGVKLRCIFLFSYTNSCLIIISQGEGSWTHVKEIASTRLLVSVQHDYYKSANVEVFDVSWKGQARKVYSFVKVSGGKFLVKIHLLIILVTGGGDVTYNPRRRILGAIPVGGEVSYHLFNFASSKDGNSVIL